MSNGLVASQNLQICAMILLEHQQSVRLLAAEGTGIRQFDFNATRVLL